MQTRLSMALLTTVLLASAVSSASSDPTPPAEQLPAERYAWGASAQTVLAGRPKPFHSGPGGIVYKDKLGEIGGLLTFRFVEDKLTEVRYRFGAKQQTAAGSLADFNSIEQLLLQQHGAPRTREEEWLDPSERNADLSSAIADGKLSQMTHWRIGRTAIIHSIYGEQGKINHMLVFQPLDQYEALFPAPEPAVKTSADTAVAAQPQ
jgi:hypothetical protein